jgi:AraC-like DNA-binding protein
MEFLNPQSVFPLHVHDFHQLTFVFSGSASFFTENEIFEIKSGSVLNVKPGQAHGYKSVKNLVLMNIFIKPYFFEENYFDLQSLPGYQTIFGEKKQNSTDKSPVFHYTMDIDTFLQSKGIIKKASEELKNHPMGYQGAVAVLILYLLILIHRNYNENNCGNVSYGAETLELIDYVKNNYRGSITIEHLIKISGKSESYILRLFKHHLGKTPIQYINHLRITDAKKDLLNSKKSITYIALDLGFNDSNYFARCFKKHFGISPSDYRNFYLQRKI